MQITTHLATEISNYIVNLLNKNVTITTRDGVCISSPNEEQVGQSLPLPPEVFVHPETSKIDLDSKPHSLIPLQQDGAVVAYLILDDDPEAIKTYIPLIKSFAELLVQQYYENNKPVLDNSDQFVSKLLNNATPADYPLYESEARVLGYDLSVQRLALVIRLKGFWEQCLLAFDQPSFEREDVIKRWKESIEKEINGFFTKSSDNIVAYLGNDKFVVFKSVEVGDEENTVKLLKRSHKAIFDPLNKFQISDITVGFGNAATGVKGLIDSYREADIALEFGHRVWGPNKSYYFGDLGILAILADGNREKKVQFAQNLLGRLTNQDLTKTLECFFDNNLNLTETANAMKIHRNTVIYRLNQISEVLEADPRVFEQAMTIKTALLIRSLLG